MTSTNKLTYLSKRRSQTYQNEIFAAHFHSKKDNLKQHLNGLR